MYSGNSIVPGTVIPTSNDRSQFVTECSDPSATCTARPRAAQEAVAEPAARCALERHRRGIAAGIFTHIF